MSHFIEAKSTEGRKAVVNLETANVIAEDCMVITDGEESPTTTIVWHESKITVYGSPEELRARPRVQMGLPAGTVEGNGPGQTIKIPEPRSRFLRWLDQFRRARPPFAGPPGPYPEPPPRPRAPGPKDARDGGTPPPLPPRSKDTREGKPPPPRAPEGPPAEEVRKGGGRRRYPAPMPSWWEQRQGR